MRCQVSRFEIVRLNQLLSSLIIEPETRSVCVVLQGPTLLKKLAQAAEEEGLKGIGLSNTHGPARTTVLLHKEGLVDDEVARLASALNIRLLCLADLMNRCQPMSPGRQPEITRQDLATIVYTSGTTGRPKG